MPDASARLTAATSVIAAPLAAIDEPALWHNADDLVRRAGGVPIRVATKSVRVRDVIERTLRRPGFAGLMTYSLAESIWLADLGYDDILLAYPTVDRQALELLVADERRTRAITLMVDSIEGLDVLERAVGTGHGPLRVAIDVDCSLRVGPAHLGVRRSPLRKPADVGAVARVVASRPAFDLVGLMFYDAQIAGLPDSSAAVRLVKARSAHDLATRRGAVVAAAREHADLTLVNAGGTGSLEVTGKDPSITELTAGSGLFSPTLFDGYDSFNGSPAALYAHDVVRKPAPDIATLFSGGYVASGQTHKNRQPRPTYPEGLSLIGTEGAGEVQTPVRGEVAKSLRIGDRVWMRHAKAGEMCERFDAVHVVAADGVVRTVPTYRGEGKNFG